MKQRWKQIMASILVLVLVLGGLPSQTTKVLAKEATSKKEVSKDEERK